MGPWCLKGKEHEISEMLYTRLFYKALKLSPDEAKKEWKKNWQHYDSHLCAIYKKLTMLL